MNLTRRTTTIAIALLVVVSAAACGSTSSKTSTSATTTTAAAGSATTAAGSATTAAGSATTLPTSYTPSTVKASGGGSFCKEVADSYNNGIKNATGLSTDPASMKKEFSGAEAEMSKAEGDAPGAIKSELKTEFAATKQFFDALAAANYDFTKISPTAEQGMATPQVAAAEAKVNAWVKQHCGIDLSAAASGAGA